jgi:hypothetical protein
VGGRGREGVVREIEREGHWRYIYIERERESESGEWGVERERGREGEEGREIVREVRCESEMQN